MTGKLAVLILQTHIICILIISIIHYRLKKNKIKQQFLNMSLFFLGIIFSFTFLFFYKSCLAGNGSWLVFLLCAARRNIILALWIFLFLNTIFAYKDLFSHCKRLLTQRFWACWATETTCMPPIVFIRIQNLFFGSCKTCPKFNFVTNARWLVLFSFWREYCVCVGGGGDAKMADRISAKTQTFKRRERIVLFVVTCYVN